MPDPTAIDLDEVRRHAEHLFLLISNNALPDRDHQAVQPSELLLAGDDLASALGITPPGRAVRRCSEGRGHTEVL